MRGEGYFGFAQSTMAVCASVTKISFTDNEMNIQEGEWQVKPKTPPSAYFAYATRVYLLL